MKCSYTGIRWYRMNNSLRYTKYPIALGVYYVALVYYYFLAAKEWTWLFVSSDSGSWIAAASTWMVPQPLGSPLYISLGHLMNWLPGDLIPNMVVGLSVIPAAVTVALVYLIAVKLTNSSVLGLLASGILLACGLFLSQATIVEEYALLIMFVTLSLYFHVHYNRWGVVLALAAGSAIHIIVVVIAILWLIMALRGDASRQWRIPALTYVGVTTLCYLLIPIIMLTDGPRFWAGWLSFASIIGYWTNTNTETIGTIGLGDMPVRLLRAGSMLLLSFGFALVPIAIHIRKLATLPLIRIMLVAVCATFWLHLTSIDPTSWTWLSFSAPMIAILAVMGLNHMHRAHRIMVTVGVVGLLIANSFLLNAAVLTRDNPWASNFQEDVMELPQGAYVIVSMGGPYGLGIMKATIIDRPDITPLFIGYADTSEKIPPRWSGYLDWLRNHKGVDVAISRTEPGTADTIEMARWAVEKGEQVFWCDVSATPDWEGVWSGPRFNDSFEIISEGQSTEDQIKDLLDKETGGTITLPAGEYSVPFIYGEDGLIRWGRP